MTLLLFGYDLNIYGFVGMIMLAGIGKKDATDFALAAEKEHGKSPLDAIYEGCVVCFRPIIMTTMRR